MSDTNSLTVSVTNSLTASVASSVETYVSNSPPQPKVRKYCFLDNPSLEEQRSIIGGIVMAQWRVEGFKKMLERVKWTLGDKDKDKKIKDLTVEIDKATSDIAKFRAQLLEYRKARDERLILKAKE
jgi:hypothetical protein